MTAAVVDLASIHQAVCDTVNATLPEVRCYPGFRDNLQPPCVVVVGHPDRYVELDLTMLQGTVSVNLTVLLLGSPDDRAGQEQIMRWLSAGVGQTESIPNALSADRTLGGKVAGFVYGATRYASALEYPTGSSARYAIGELELQAHV